MLKAFLAVLGLAGIGYAAQRSGEARDRRRYPAPGTFVEADGARLHVVVSGSGPVVLMDSGLGGSSAEWAEVAALLEGEMTVVRYDRPGFGWSPAAAGDRSPAAVARRIRALLAALDAPGPAVLAGHSLGGLHVRMVASLYPDLVSGLVLVDPSHEDMLDAAEVPAAARVVEKGMRAAAVLAPLGLARLAGAVYSRVATGQLRRAADPGAREALERSARLTSRSVAGLRAVVAELAVLPASLRQVRELSASHPLRPIPVVVITAAGPARSSAEAKARKVIDELHRQLAESYQRGRQVFAEQSGHLVPLDQPELVAECIGETAREAARAAG